MAKSKIIKELPIKLRELRNKHNISQDKLATELEITQSAYNHIETGKTLPNIEQLQTLSQFYKITIGELLGEATHVYNIQENNKVKGNMANHLTIQNEKLLEHKDKIISIQETRIKELEEKISRRDKKIEELKKIKN